MKHNLVVAVVAVAVVLAGVFVACGGTPVHVSGADGGDLLGSAAITGVVVKGPVAQGRVTAYKLDPTTFARGAAVGTAVTDATGAFALGLSLASGPLVVVASSGTYLEEAIGLGVKLDGSELVALVPAYKAGSRVEGLHVTPVSTFVAALALYHAGNGRLLAEAYSEAFAHLNAHFGGVDWATVAPADFTVDAGINNLSPEAKAGLVLSGLSWLSKVQAEAAQQQPGVTVNAATLTAALAQDATDGTFDGKAGAGQLKQASTNLDGLTLRQGLVRGITGFLNSPRNASALQMADVTAFLAAIGTDSDPYLFCPGQVATSACGSNPVDTEPPTLSFLRPADGAGVAGSVVVEVHAADNVKLASVKFTAPASLTTTTPTLSDDKRGATLLATLDVSALPDGPVTIRAEATDDSGNPAAKSITVTVSNQGPRVSLSTPSQGAPVKGTITVAATASAQAPGANIAKLELVGPPPGVGADTLPAADSFSASWDTTKAPEGQTALTIRATDSFGTSTDATITVTVDNIPFGVITAAVSAGPGIDGLTVQLVAIDDATGLPVTGRVGGPILGTSSGATVDGGITFALSQENYSGPVQLVASGLSATYVDPSDDATVINLPSTFNVTTYVPKYTTGAPLAVPVTLWSTLADAAALAYLQGRNPTQPSPVTLTTALSATDPLFATHITNRAWKVRTTVPVRLTVAPQSLRDVVYAAMPDVALNRLARDLAGEVGLTPGTGFSAPMLVELLRDDIADGLFDGQATGRVLKTAGDSPYTLDANTTRLRQALGLDAFVRSTANKSGLTPVDLRTSGIYDTISADTSILYPTSEPPIPFDDTPPTLTWVVTFANGGQANLPAYGSLSTVAGVLSVDVTGADPSGVASLAVVANGNLPVTPTTVPTTSHFAGTFATTSIADGSLTVSATACDRLDNCTTVTKSVTVDNTQPTLLVTKPQAGAYSTNIDVDATAVDITGIASLTVSGLPGVTDTNPTPVKFVASWPVTGADGVLPVSIIACDYVANCLTQAVSGVVADRTPPTIAWHTVPGSRSAQATTTVTLDASDASSSVGAVYVRAGSQTAQAVHQSGNTWSAAVPLDGSGSPTPLTAWAVDAASATPNSGQGHGAPYEATAAVTYDNTPPTVAWTNTFTNGALNAVPPVGNRVGGILSIIAAASDPAGVSSLSVTLDGVTLAPTSSTASRLGATYDTHSHADGNANLVATACDTLNNCGQMSLTLIIDNSPPAISVAAPVAPASSFFSTVPAISATALDPSGVPSHVVASSLVANLQSANTGTAGVVTVAADALPIPPAVTDGAFTLTFTATDSVGNVATSTVTSKLDRTPPTATLLSAPGYINVTSATITAKFADSGAGISAAKAINTSLGLVNPPVIAGNCSPASGASVTCTFAMTLNAVDGPNTIVLWAEDGAQPANGSSTNVAPMTASANVVKWATAPNPILSDTLPYADERGTSVGADSLTGIPYVPAQYSVPSSAVQVQSGVTLYKITAKSFAGDRNTPTIRVGFSQQAASQPPIVAATWKVAPGQAIANFTTGSLASTTGPSPLTSYYALPVNNPSPGKLDITFSFTDAAGNTTTVPYSLSYVYVGAPIRAVLDTSYATYGDSTSVWPYGLTTYDALLGQPRRMARVILYNPNYGETVWVAPSLSLSGNPAWTEQWGETLGATQLSAPTDLGTSWLSYYDWYSDLPETTGADCTPGKTSYFGTNSGVGVFPCGWDTAPVHYYGDSGNIRCEARTAHFNGAGNPGPYPLINYPVTSTSLWVGQSPQPKGSEVTEATTVNFTDAAGNPATGFVLPPPSGSTPGSLVVYAQLSTPARPVTGINAANFPVRRFAPAPGHQWSPSFSAGWLWRKTVQNSQLACFKCSPWCSATNGTAYYNHGWTAFPFSRDLTSFSVHFSGAVALQTHPSMPSVPNGTSASLGPTSAFDLSK